MEDVKIDDIMIIRLKNYSSYGSIGLFVNCENNFILFGPNSKEPISYYNYNVNEINLLEDDDYHLLFDLNSEIDILEKKLGKKQKKAQAKRPYINGSHVAYILSCNRIKREIEKYEQAIKNASSSFDSAFAKCISQRINENKNSSIWINPYEPYICIVDGICYDIYALPDNNGDILIYINEIKFIDKDDIMFNTEDFLAIHPHYNITGSIEDIKDKSIVKLENERGFDIFYYYNSPNYIYQIEAFKTFNDDFPTKFIPRDREESLKQYSLEDLIQFEQAKTHEFQKVKKFSLFHD